MCCEVAMTASQGVDDTVVTVAFPVDEAVFSVDDTTLLTLGTVHVVPFVGNFFKMSSFAFQPSCKIIKE